jgi:hypothetical protein
MELDARQTCTAALYPSHYATHRIVRRRILQHIRQVRYGLPPFLHLRCWLTLVGSILMQSEGRSGVDDVFSLHNGEFSSIFEQNKGESLERETMMVELLADAGGSFPICQAR